MGLTVKRCNLSITSFSGTNTPILDPSAGGSIPLTGTISDDSGKTIYWTMSVAGETYTGTGTSASVTWDGKDASGKVVDPGEYSATLTAQTADGQCSDTKTINFAVEPPPDNSCGLYVDFGSSANVANGNLSHRQDMFSVKGGAVPLSVTLYYNSLDPSNGSLGRGWSNSYDNSLVQNSDGSVLIKDGNWRRMLYTLVNGAYVDKPNDYSTLAKNSDNTFSLIKKDGTKYNYSADGKITSIVDRNNNTVTFAYSAGNLSTITDPAGHTAALSYDADNHLTSLIDPSGNSYTFTYSNGTLATVTYPDGGKWLYTYDDKAFMLTKMDPLANITTYSYDDSHRVVSSTDANGKTRSISYPTGTDTVKTTTFTQKDGGVWSYTYDTQAGTLTSKTDPQSGVTSYTYDANGNRLSTTAPDGTATSSTYDAQGNMTSTTDALGQITAYAYNAFGQVTSIKDPQGNTTSYVYDAAGNMTSMTDSTGATTTYAYDARGNVTKVTNAAGQATTFIYDTSGNLVSVTDPSGAKTSFTYDASGNMLTQTDASGATTSFEYDAKNQLVKMTDSLGNVTTYTYDLAGNRVTATDANGNTTLYAYNAKGQVVKTTDALGNVTTYTYGATGCPSCGGGVDKLTALADANGNSTTYMYDTLGRLISETDPLGNITSYSYDAKGNLTTKTDANGNIIQYTYDSLGRLLKKGYPDNTEETFTYDAKGNILTATNKNISYTITYDAAGRMLTSTDSNGRNASYAYDALGNKTKMTSPEGKAITYRYDAANRLTTITNGGIFNFSYDQLGRRTKLLYPNGATANYSYDNAGRLASLVHKTGNNRIIDSFTYTLDNVGNRLSKTEPDVKITYGYDTIYRLLQALPAQPHAGDNDRDDHINQGPQAGETYAYDPVGNRLAGPQDRLSYLYNQGNQLIEQSLKNHNSHKDHIYGKAEYTYDKNGNLIKKVEPEGHHQKTTTLYTYDFENELVKVEIQRGHQEKVVTFTYDPFGRRLSRAVQREDIDDDDDKDRDGKGCGHDRHAPRTTNYFYDSQNILMEYDEKGKIVARYVQGPGTDEHLAIYKNGEPYYYHADGLGSITALTDKHGNVEQKYEYDSFGNMKQDGEGVDQHYTYTGREWDKETGLYYYRARYYDPMEGRFVSKDPIGFKGGINFYAYTSNNPVNKRDPKGLDALDDAWELDNQLDPTWEQLFAGTKDYFCEEISGQISVCTDLVGILATATGAGAPLGLLTGFVSVTNTAFTLAICGPPSSKKDVINVATSIASAIQWKYKVVGVTLSIADAVLSYKPKK